MITVFNQCARCLLEPYAVLFVLFGIMLIWSKKITVFYISVLCFALAVIWRSIFLISSSRYCAVFLLVIPIAAAYIARDYSKGWRGSIITLVLGVFLRFPFLHPFETTIFLTSERISLNYPKAILRLFSSSPERK